MDVMMETQEKPQIEYYLNKSTGRYIKVGSSTHKRLIKKLNCVKPIPQRVAPEPEDLSKDLLTGNIKVQELNSNDVLRHELMQQSVAMVKENMKSLGGVESMSDDEMDKMLRRLLIEKLGLGKSKKRKTKKKKKARFKVVTPPPSSSESDTESDSN
jgi:hypothetical protein